MASSIALLIFFGKLPLTTIIRISADDFRGSPVAVQVGSEPLLRHLLEPGQGRENQSQIRAGSRL